MIKTSPLIVRTKWVDQHKGFFLYVTLENGHFLPVDDWISDLFTWHQETFYGSFLDKAADESGLYLSPWQALHYFSADYFSSFSLMEWKEESKWLRKIAPLICEEIQTGNFHPDFEAWKNGQLKWKVPNLENEMIDYSFSNDWIHSAIEEWIDNDQELSEAWNAILESNPLLKKQETIETNRSFLSENTWLEKIGWKEDPTPFTVGLRLSEPVESEEQQQSWNLEIILIDKQNKNNIIEMNHTEGQYQLPVSWAKDEYLDRINQEQTNWMQLEPSLKHDEFERLKKHLTEDEAWHFLTDTSLTLAEAGVDVLLPSWWQEIKDMRPMLKMSVDSTKESTQSFVGMNSIIQFNWKLSTRDLELDEEQFLKLVNEKRKLIQINGKWMKLDPSFLKYMQSLMRKVNEEGLHFRDVLEQQMLQDADFEQTNEETDNIYEHIQIELSQHLERMIQQLTKNSAIPKVKITDKLQGELRPYQHQGVEWLLFLRKFGFGACLADDMGLGKTIQIITYLLQVQELEENMHPALIICPTSVLGNWQKEIERFAPSLNIHIYYGSNRNKERFDSQYDVILTTYTVASLDEEELSQANWGSIILDEAQNIKNAQTKQSRAIRKLQGQHHIALTGTPIENRLSELWSIYDFTNPGYLGSQTNFQKRFAGPIEKEKNTEKIKQVQRLVKPFLLRRTKKDKEINLNLPDKQEQKEFCPLTIEQASMYEQVVQDTFKQLEQESGMKRRGLILSMLTKLKQICNHPALYLKEEQNSETNFIERSHKCEKLMELVENMIEQDESCLIFTQYIEMGHMLQKLIQEHFQEEVLYLHGGISKTHRDQMVDQFQNKKARILILSLRAGGTGLNLTAANHVIHYDRWWNPAVENQATDRAYRIGQKRFVHVHKLITNGTLEEKIDEMIEAKKSLSDDIISGENWITELSTTELKELFTLRREWDDTDEERS